MADVGFKKITLENWSQPDPIYNDFIKLSANGEPLQMSTEDWIAPLLIPSLSNNVPIDVRALFAVARGAMVYAYYFYPLWTLGIEQHYRVVEAAVSHKCNELGAPRAKRRFVDKIDWLETAKSISFADKKALNEIRELRNMSSHPDRQSILSPSVAISLLETISTVINSIFDCKNAHDSD